MVDTDLALPAEIDRDTLFRALAHRRRRYVLAFLCDEQASVSQTTVTYAVIEMDSGESLDGIPSDHCKRVYLDLEHSHLPHLVEAGLVMHDREADEITLTRSARQFESVLYTLAGGHQLSCGQSGMMESEMSIQNECTSESSDR